MGDTDLQFYPTPAWAIRQLYSSIGDVPRRMIQHGGAFDPCAGEGAFSAAWPDKDTTWTQWEVDKARALKAGAENFDFFTKLDVLPKTQAVIFNPPFNRAIEFLKALRWHYPIAACLLRSTFLGSPRAEFIRRDPPFILHLAHRFKGPTKSGKMGSDTAGRLWLVWGIGRPGQYEMAPELSKEDRAK